MQLKYEDLSTGICIDTYGGRIVTPLVHCCLGTSMFSVNFPSCQTLEIKSVHVALCLSALGTFTANISIVCFSDNNIVVYYHSGVDILKLSLMTKETIGSLRFHTPNCFDNENYENNNNTNNGNYYLHSLNSLYSCK